IGESTKNHRDGVIDHILGVYGGPQDQPSSNEPDNTQCDSNTSNTSHQFDDSDSDESDRSDSPQSNDSDSHSVGDDSDTFTLDPNPPPKEKKKPFKFEKGLSAVARSVVDRAVVRIVFTEKGLPLWKIKSCRELLLATRDWVTGIQELWQRKIVHRDISTGNLLISETPGKPAFLIDLGLAHYEKTSSETIPSESVEKAQDCARDQESSLVRAVPDDISNGYCSEKFEASGQQEASQEREEGGERRETARDHHHLTGTLPFISHEVLDGNIQGSPISSTYHHDIESIFWVLLYLCLMDTTERASKKQLSLLNSSEPDFVYTCKTSLLTKGLKGLVFADKFEALAPFLREFSTCFWNGVKKCPPVKFEVVFEMIDRTLRRLEEESAAKKGPRPETKEVVSALEVPSLAAQDDHTNGASTQHRPLSKQSSKRKLADLETAGSVTTTDEQPGDEDDVGEGSSRGGSRRRVI
ncbi:hypothetical protein FRB90_007016, partial [Tulasnella sp. 427]